MSLARYCQDKRVVIQNSRSSAYEAARALESNHVGAIAVQEEGRLVGLLTDRDLALRVIGLELDPKQTLLHDIMSPEPVTLSPEDSEQQAIMLMRARHVRRIPIVEDGRIVGIVTLDDLLLTGSVDRATAASIIEAQLAEPSELKPPGVPHPVPGRTTH